MTKEEMIAFVTAECEKMWRWNPTKRMTIDQVAKVIVTKWEDEIDEAFQRGVHAGQETFDPNFRED